MIEVEVKARVKDFDSVKKRLAEKGAEFVKSLHQIDKIFGHKM